MHTHDNDMASSTDLRYPVGKFDIPGFSDNDIGDALTEILYLPRKLEYAILNLDAAHLDTPYREGGWTLAQVVHHVADSHMNAYIRCKLGLTEDQPVIKPYDEAKWAELPDVRSVPVNISLTLLHALHARWHEMFKQLKPDQWDRAVMHPGSGRLFTIRQMLGLYAWHGRHHVAHITGLRDRMGW